MKNKFLISVITLAGAALVFAAAPRANAATPTLSMSGTSANSVQMNITGDPNANINFYYNVGSAAGTKSIVLGVTDASGRFVATVNTSGYGMDANSSVYVVVNNQQSATQVWTLGSAASAGSSPTLSQSNVVVGLGQSTTVLSQGNSTAIYVASNSNYAIANIQVSGTQITVTGNQVGSVTASICYMGTSANCTNLNVTVQAGSVVTFSQNNLTLTVGQSLNVILTGGSGTYSVSGNTNSAALSAALNGSTLTVSAIAIGSANVTVCDNASNCGILYVTVNAAGTGQGVTFGNSSPVLTAGSNMNVSLGGGTGYYVASNSNSAAIQASVSGNSLILNGLGAGSAALSVCGSGVSCSTLNVTVNAVGTSSAPVSNTTQSQAALLTAIQSMQTQLTQILSQIQNMATTLSQLASQLNISAPVSGNTGTATAGSYAFTQFLSLGSQNAEVTALQQRLTALGYYSGPVTGYFGALTEAALVKYQQAHGITGAGYVGPSTREALNSGK